MRVLLNSLVKRKKLIDLVTDRRSLTANGRREGACPLQAATQHGIVHDHVDAGRAMIQSAHPKQAGVISTAGWAYETNRLAIDKCIADMIKTQKQQKCTLILPVVETRSGQ